MNLRVLVVVVALLASCANSAEDGASDPATPTPSDSVGPSRSPADSAGPPASPEPSVLPAGMYGPVRDVSTSRPLTRSSTRRSAVPATAPTWHRLNPHTHSGLAEHEQLHCFANRQWVCRYDKAPEPGLHWDRTIGTFHGRLVDLAAWECPEWLGAGVCAEVTMVVAGKINFADADGSAFQVWNELIFTSGDSVAPLYVHWPDSGFACAWHESFEDAVAADPAMEGNCLFAP